MAKAAREKMRRNKMRGKSKPHARAVVNGSNQTEFMRLPQLPNKDIVKQYQEGTGNTLFRDRNGSIHIRNHRTPEMIAFWEARYPSMKYSKREMKERGMPDEYGIIRNNPVPRGEALRRADELVAASDITMHYRLVQSYSINVDLFFNAKKTKFYLLETNLDLRVIRKSATYNYPELIKQAYRKGNVFWIETIEIGPE